MNEQTDKPSHRRLWDKIKVLLIIGTPVLLFVVLAAWHQFRPEHPLVRWLWIVLWLVILPAVLFYFLFVFPAKGAKKKSEKK